MQMKQLFSEKEAKDVIAQVIDALIYCHKFNVVHRDIKPENLLFSDLTKTIKISDFGLATFIQED